MCEGFRVGRVVQKLSGAPWHAERNTAWRGRQCEPKHPTIAKGMEQIRKACEDYSPNHLLNVDETGLVYVTLPKKTYLSTVENRRTARGTKGMKAKDLLSAIVCANATGTFNIPIAIIGKAKNPRCFAGKNVLCGYLGQANAWSDIVTFRKWWNKHLPKVHRRIHHSVLLLMDG